MAEAIRALPTGAAVQTRVPLRCFNDLGANLKSVGSPIRIQAAKGLVVTLRNVHIETAKQSVTCPGKVR
jgi:beta-glucosidase